MIVMDRPEPIEPRIFVRGNAERLGLPVPRRMPTLLAHVSHEPFPATTSGRLEIGASHCQIDESADSSCAGEPRCGAGILTAVS